MNTETTIMKARPKVSTRYIGHIVLECSLILKPFLQDHHDHHDHHDHDHHDHHDHHDEDMFVTKPATATVMSMLGLH